MTPKWTVLGQKEISGLIGFCSFYFHSATEATIKYDELTAEGWVVVMRPWNRVQDLPKMHYLDQEMIDDSR